jgi:hypothetical protein
MDCRAGKRGLPALSARQDTGKNMLEVRTPVVPSHYTAQKNPAGLAAPRGRFGGT